MSATALPSALAAGVERNWGEKLGRRPEIAVASTVPGGCISRVTRIETNTGDVACLKWGDGPDTRRMFAEEARSLTVLAGVAAIRVPRVLAEGQSETEAGVWPWLLLEWLEPGAAADTAWRALGAGFARLHQTRAEAYGWPADNFIGSLPQSNPRRLDWSTFWYEHRLEPQIRLAAAAGRLGDLDRRRFDRLLRGLDSILAPAAEEGPSLLHGDLWSGNVHPLTGGEIAIIDPASYFGHREVDLAMAELFGGFPPSFHSAYHEVWPLRPNYAQRRPVYQLYYLLVHVNLFGAAYLPITRASLQSAGF